VNSGAYIHCIVAGPSLYIPERVTTDEYSNTYVPFGRKLKKKFIDASLLD